MKEANDKIKELKKKVRIWQKCDKLFNLSSDSKGSSPNACEEYVPEMTTNRIEPNVVVDPTSDSCDQDSSTSVEPASRDTTTGIFGDSYALLRAEQ